jgi:hypothetical protein
MGVETLGAAQRRTPTLTLTLPLPRGGNELDHAAHNHKAKRDEVEAALVRSLETVYS